MSVIIESAGGGSGGGGDPDVTDDTTTAADLPIVFVGAIGGPQPLYAGSTGPTWDPSSITLKVTGGEIQSAQFVASAAINVNDGSVQGGMYIDGSPFMGALSNHSFIITGNNGTVAQTISGANTVFAGLIKPKSYTVGTLPAGTEGDIAYVTDQLTTVNARGSAPTGGGSVKCAQFCTAASTWVGL